MAGPGLAGRGRRLGHRPDGRGGPAADRRRRAARLPVVDGHPDRHRRRTRVVQGQRASACATRPALYEVLQRRCAGHVLDPIALDVDRGWLLLPDGGRTLRDVEGATHRPRAVGADARRVRAAATVARAVRRRAARRGRPGRRAGASCRRSATRCSTTRELLLVGEADGLTEPTSWWRLASTRRSTPSSCARLDAFGIAPTLQHDDLHDNNVFAPSAPGGPLRVFDWGDAVVGHPFGTLLVTLRVVSDLARARAGRARAAPAARRLPRGLDRRPRPGRPRRGGPARGAGGRGVAGRLLPAGHDGVGGQPAAHRSPKECRRG